MRGTGKAAALRAGTYTLRGGMSLEEIVGLLSTPPKTVATADVLVPPGYRVDPQIADRLQQALGIPATRSSRPPRAADSHCSRTCPRVRRRSRGSSIPTRTGSPRTARRLRRDHHTARRVQAQDERPPWKDAKALGVTPYQIVVVASMIEKEAGIDADRPKIAAVIYNRLRRGMPLGIDATVAYIDPNPTDGAHRRRPRDRQPVQHPAAARAAAHADREPRPSPRWKRRSRRRTSRTSTTWPAARTAPAGSARPTPVPATTRRVALAEPPGPPIGGASRTVGIIGWPVDPQPVARDPQRGVRGDGDGVGVRAAARRPRRPARGPRRAGALGFAGANVTMPHKTDDRRPCRLAVRGRPPPAGREHARGRGRGAPRSQHGRARVRPIPAPGRRVRAVRTLGAACSGRGGGARRGARPGARWPRANSRRRARSSRCGGCSCRPSRGSRPSYGSWRSTTRRSCDPTSS